MSIYQHYLALNPRGELFGLEFGDSEGGYYCTPLGMTVLGWENGIHYGNIKGFGEMIFAVNPENFGNSVYPVAKNFEDFLRLIFAAGSTTAIEQIVLWNREQYERFLSEDEGIPGGKEELLRLSKALSILPMEDAFTYVKQLQAEFHGEIPYSNEYYDTAGLPRPDGSSPDEEEAVFTAEVSFEIKK